MVDVARWARSQPGPSEVERGRTEGVRMGHSEIGGNKELAEAVEPALDLFGTHHIDLTLDDRSLLIMRSSAIEAELTPTQMGRRALATFLGLAEIADRARAVVALDVFGESISFRLGPTRTEPLAGSAETYRIEALPATVAMATQVCVRLGIPPSRLGDAAANTWNQVVELAEADATIYRIGADGSSEPVIRPRELLADLQLFTPLSMRSTPSG